MDFHALQQKLFKMDPTDPAEDLAKLRAQAQGGAVEAAPTKDYVTEFLCQLGPRKVHGDRLDHGLHLLPELLVGHPEYGHVGHLLVGDEEILDLLRIDVHAPGNDHEGLPVR